MQFRTFAEAMPNHVWTAKAYARLARLVQPACLHGHPGQQAGSNRRPGLAIPGISKLPLSRETRAGAGVKHVRRNRVPAAAARRRLPLVHSARRSICDTDGAILCWIGTNTDIDDQKQTTQALQQSERRSPPQNAAGIAALQLHIASGTVVTRASGVSGAFRARERAYQRSGKHRHSRGQGRPFQPETRKQGTAAPAVEYRIRRPQMANCRPSRHIDFVHDETGSWSRCSASFRTSPTGARPRRDRSFSTHELEHRIKNILAMVAAIASQTLRNTDIATASATFNERLRALANAHDILNKTRWTSASIREVVDNTIAAFPLEQISISGPALPINPKMALTLALAVNELATNALKYGALSTPDGKVAIEWSLQPSHDSPVTSG